jgi:cytochrome P450
MTSRAVQPPGPPLPPTLQSLAFRVAPLRFTEMCRRRYGEVVMFRTLHAPPFTVVFDAKLVREMLQHAPEDLPTVDAVVRRVLGERSILGWFGADRRHRRRLLRPHLQGERITDHTSGIRDATDRVIDTWPTGEAFALVPAMRSLTYETIAAMVLGPNGGDARSELIRRVQALIPALGPPPRRIRRPASGSGDRRPVDELLSDEIARRRARPDRREDILSVLLSARDVAGEPLTDPELRDHVVTLLVAGGETLASGLAWAFELLLHHPPALERLEAEVGRGDEEYLEAVVKETLRVRPPAASVVRVVQDEPYVLGGYLIPPQSVVRASISAMHRQADHFTDPLAFRPERFLGRGEGGAAALLPFGAGAHSCLGASFAPFEMGIVIRRVLERTHLRPADRRSEKGAPGGFAQLPARGVRVIKQPRSGR